MTTIQNIIIVLFVLACAAFPCILAKAQDTTKAQRIHVGSAYLDVEVKQGHTDVCTRVDAKSLICTRFENGKATSTFTVKL